MLRIAVVDDEAEQRELIESFLARFACEQRREIIVDTYCNGFDFLSVFDQRYDAVFLDIQMPDANGIQVAEEIRAIDQRVKIIFITNLGQYAQGYAVRAMDFIVKPLEWESFSEKMRFFAAITMTSNRDL
ncbi:MAG: LytR/AlgR family response regulator transcription factor [Coriobacteriaceae bacterium]